MLAKRNKWDFTAALDKWWKRSQKLKERNLALEHQENSPKYWLFINEEMKVRERGIVVEPRAQKAKNVDEK